MHKEAVDHRIAIFIAACRQHQLKVTPQRVAVYRALIQSEQHPTADMMFQVVRQAYPNMSFDTVNRTLLTFAGVGLVDVVEVFGGPKRFDPNIEDHHHLHCMACGQITDFSYASYSRLEVPVDIARKFKVIGKRVVLRGLCAACNPKR